MAATCTPSRSRSTLGRAILVALSVTCTSLGWAGPVPDDFEVRKAIDTACDLLLANQERYEPDRPVGTLPENQLMKWQEGERARLEKVRKAATGREWPYEGVYRVRPDGRIPPGYRVGGSAIVCEALLFAPGFDDKRRGAIERATEFILEMIHEDPGMQPRKQTNYDVRGWGQAYALKFFLHALDARCFDADLAERVRASIPHLIEGIRMGEVNGGGWNYAGRGVSPFMTASTLLALFHARDAGYAVDTEMVERALDALEQGRGEGAAYAYSGRLRRGEEPMQGASARSAVAELVLHRAGRSTVERLRDAVDGFFNEENWKELLKRKSQQGTHVAPYGVAPYYFFFGHTYAAYAAEHLPAGERARYRTSMRDLLWRTIEKHGGWNDRVFPRTESYSTAMALLSLIAPQLPQAHQWSKRETL